VPANAMTVLKARCISRGFFLETAGDLLEMSPTDVRRTVYGRHGEFPSSAIIG
jgi:hypothetical protein